MKKNILVLSILFAGIFNLRAEPVEYCSVQVKSINDVTNVATVMGADLQLGVMAYSLPMLLAQSISEGLVTPVLDKPITAYIYVDSELSMLDEFEPEGIVVCIPHASSEEAIIEKHGLEAIDAEKKIYENQEFCVIFKSGYAIFGDNQALCGKIAAKSEYTLKTTLNADTIILKYDHAGFSTTTLSKSDIAKFNSELSKMPPVVSKYLTKILNISIEIMNVFNAGEMGLTYKKDLGFICEAKSNFDESSEIGKAIKSQVSFISTDEAMKLNQKNVASVLIKECETDKYLLNKIFSEFSLSQAEFNELFAELIKKEDLIEDFPELKKEGMNVKCYEAIKKFMTDFLASYNATEEDFLLLDINENNHPVIFEKITYKKGYDASSFEEDTYKALIDTYNYAMYKAEYTPSSPLIEAIDPMAVRFNFDAVLNEVKKISSEDEIAQINECIARAKDINITIPEKYIMETIVDGNESYAYFAPEKYDLSKLKNKLSESSENLFVRAAMQDMADNKATSVMFLSIGNLFNKGYDIFAPLLEIEEELNSAGIAKRDQWDGIVFISGVGSDCSVYEKYVVGKDTLLLMANIVSYCLNNSMYEEAYHEEDAFDEDCSNSEEDELIEAVVDEVEEAIEEE